MSFGQIHVAYYEKFIELFFITVTKLSVSFEAKRAKQNIFIFVACDWLMSSLTSYNDKWASNEKRKMYRLLIATPTTFMNKELDKPLIPEDVYIFHVTFM